MANEELLTQQTGATQAARLKSSINLAEQPMVANEVAEVQTASPVPSEPAPPTKRRVSNRQSRRRSEPAAAAPEEPPTVRPLPTDPRVVRRVVLAGLVAVLMVAGTVIGSYLWYSRDDAPQPALEGAVAPVEGSSVLIVATDAADRAVSVGVMTNSGSEQSSVVLFPGALLIEIPGFGTHRLADAHVLGGVDSVRHAIMNELGIAIDGVAVLSPGDLASTLERDLEITLSSPFLQPDYNGAVVTAGVGAASYTPDEIEAMLVTVGTGGEIEFVQRQRSVWEGYIAELARTPGLVDDFADEDDVGSALIKQGLGAERVTTTVAPVRQVGVGETQLLGLAADPAFFDLHFGSIRMPLDPRPRVEILNGTREVGITQAIAGELIEKGFWILRTDNADRASYRETLIIAQGPAGQQEAVLVEHELGYGEIVIEQSASGSVDVSVILGADAIQ
ncbi:MAG: LCP family protein [Acidimicrobiia bacterium]|nr:LCP family protein [Acidimicrobiia bacterium]